MSLIKITTKGRYALRMMVDLAEQESRNYISLKDVAGRQDISKKYLEQIRIAQEVMHNRQLSPVIRKLVKGLMIESYIEEGCQKIGEHVYGKSITDPCLGWEDSERLIYMLAEMNAK